MMLDLGLCLGALAVCVLVLAGTLGYTNIAVVSILLVVASTALMVAGMMKERKQ